MRKLLVLALSMFVATAFSAFAQDSQPAPEQKEAAPAKKEMPAKKGKKKKKSAEEGK